MLFIAYFSMTHSDITIYVIRWQNAMSSTRAYGKGMNFLSNDVEDFARKINTMKKVKSNFKSEGNV